MLQRLIFCITLLLQCSLFSEITMKHYLEKAKPGDYVALKIHKTLTFIRIHSVDKEAISLEEISAPLKNLKPYPKSWNQWVLDKAPGHTSWSILKIDINSGKILSCYSADKRSWVQINPQESLFATLLHLPLNKVKDTHIRKIGPPPSFDEPDTRPIWKPSFIFEGKELENPVFDVFETVWPDDGSDLKNTHLTLYFDHAMHIALPIWIQFDTSHAAFHVQIIDSGKLKL